MPAFLSQRSLDSRFRGNDGFPGNDASRGNDGFSGNDASRGNATFPAHQSSPPIRHPCLPSSPPTCHSRLPPFQPTNHPRLPPFPPTRHSREGGNPLRLHHSPRSSSPTPIGDQESKAIRPMPAFLSQRSLDSRFRGNDGFWESWLSRECQLSQSHGIRHPRPSVIPAHQSFPPTRHSRESGNPLRLHHSRESSSPTPIGDQESKAIRPRPAFLSQWSLDSRFRGNDGFSGNDASRGNDGFWESWLSRECQLSQSHGIRHPRPSVIPAHQSFPPTCHSREGGNPLRLHHSPRSSSPTPIGDQESKTIRPMPAFLSQWSLDSRFRGNDGFSGNDASRGNATFSRATASAIPTHPPFPPTTIPAFRHSHPPVIPAKAGIHCASIVPPELVPEPDREVAVQGCPSNATHPSFPRKRESRKVGGKRS